MSKEGEVMVTLPTSGVDMDSLQLAQQRAKKKLMFSKVMTICLITVFAVLLGVHYCAVPLLGEINQRLKDNNSTYPWQKGLTKWLEHYDYYMMPFPFMSVYFAVLAQVGKFGTIRRLLHAVTSKDILWCVQMTEQWEGQHVRFYEQCVVFQFFFCFVVVDNPLPVELFYGILAFTMCFVMFVDYYYVRLDVNYFIVKMDGAPCELKWWWTVWFCFCLVFSYCPLSQWIFKKVDNMLTQSEFYIVNSLY